MMSARIRQRILRRRKKLAELAVKDLEAFRAAWQRRLLSWTTTAEIESVLRELRSYGAEVAAELEAETRAAIGGRRRGPAAGRRRPTTATPPDAVPARVHCPASMAKAPAPAPCLPRDGGHGGSSQKPWKTGEC